MNNAHMDVEVRSIRSDEYEPFIRAMKLGFGDHTTEDDIHQSKEKGFEPDRAIAAFHEGKIVGTTDSFHVEIAVPGHVLSSSAVQGVAVPPTHRRRGILSKLMRRQIDDLYGRGEPLAILHASESSIYGRYGFGRSIFVEEWSIDRQYTAIEHFPKLSGQVEMVGRDEANSMFAQVYDRVWLNRPGMIKRDKRLWEVRLRDQMGTKAGPPEKHREGDTAYFHAVYIRDDRPDGYVLYRVNHQNSKLYVNELIAATNEAEVALWSFCFGVDLRETVVAGNRPLDDPLQWILKDPRRLLRTVHDTLWLRLLNVREALAGRNYAQNGLLVLEIDDPFCPWNEARYELEGGPERSECRPTNGTADLRLSAADLASVYLGAVRFRTLFHAGRVQVRTPKTLAMADAMFATDLQPWCCDFF